jgi:hypothetical protein
MGNIALRRGDLEDAREHCIWALRQNPNDPSAIHLLCAIKARRSWLLGLWWRFQSFLVTFGPAWIVAILLGLYLVNRILTMVLLDMGQTDAAHTVQLAWLAFVIYTWIAPSLFQRMVQKELKQVLLRSDY